MKRKYNDDNNDNNNDDNNDDDNNNRSEGEIALRKLLSTLNMMVPIKGAFTSQLLHLSSMQAQIVSDIAHMRYNHIIRLLHCPGSTSEKSDKSFLIMIEDYLSDLEKSIHSIDNKDITKSLMKFKHWIQYSPKISIFRNELIDGTIEKLNTKYPLSNIDIDHIISIGYLSYRRDVTVNDILWFSHPKIGELGQIMTSVQSKILLALNRRRYKEISLKELKKLNIKTPYDIEYHIYELIGSNIITSTPAPSNDIVLRKKG
jgi:hypothetical protein